MLVLGGIRGVIRCMVPELNTELGNTLQHTGAVNEVTCPSAKPYLLVSASGDRSVRLWNIWTGVCIAVFHGIDGHLDEVVSVDVDPKCERIISGGIDHKLAIWDLTEPSLVAAIEASRHYESATSDRGFPTKIVAYPIYSTRDVYTNYIDCVRFFGDLVFTNVSRNAGRFLVIFVIFCTVFSDCRVI